MKIGKGTKFWHKELSNIGDCEIGDNCVIHSHVWIGDGVIIGDRVKIQAFVFIPKGVVIGNDVFIGPRTTFTNDKYPPSGSQDKWGRTIVKDFASIGACTTILPDITIGYGAKTGACSLITRDIPDGVLVYGVPAKEHKKVGE